jgi:hypothetical protein
MNMNWYRVASWSNQIGRLNNYLRSAFKPAEHSWEVFNHLWTNERITPELDELYKTDAKAFAKRVWPTLSEDDRDAVRYAVANYDATHPRTGPSPAYVNLHYRRLVRPTWLIHFTDYAGDVGQSGFQYGHPGIRGLSHTTSKDDEKRFDKPGYNYAFDLNDETAVKEAAKMSGFRGRKYGNDAVVFWSAGVEVYHWGDEENQVIFWGPSVDPNTAFPLTSRQHQWEVVNAAGRRVFHSRDIIAAARWVTQNHQMLRNVKEKEQGPTWKNPGGEWQGRGEETGH